MCVNNTSMLHPNYTNQQPINSKSRTTASAAKDGNLIELIQMVENKADWHRETTYKAALYGNFECLKYIIEHGCPIDYRTSFIAATHGHFDCFKYIVEHTGEVIETNFSYSIAARGHVKCLQYLHDAFNLQFDSTTLMNAVIYNQVQCLDYLISNKLVEWQAEATLWAIPNNAIDILKYANQLNLQWHPDSIKKAFEHNQKNVIQFIFKSATNPYDFLEDWCNKANSEPLYKDGVQHIVQLIDLDDQRYRDLLFDGKGISNVHLWPELQLRIYKKQQLIKIQCTYITTILSSYVLSDIIEHCLCVLV